MLFYRKSWLDFASGLNKNRRPRSKWQKKAWWPTLELLESRWLPAVSVTGGFSLAAGEGLTSASPTAATFTESSGDQNPADFSADIDWGDKSSSLGTITFAGGTFTISGSHLYAEEAAYSIAVTVDKMGSQVGSATSSAAV